MARFNPQAQRNQDPEPAAAPEPPEPTEDRDEPHALRGEVRGLTFLLSTMKRRGEEAGVPMSSVVDEVWLAEYGSLCAQGGYRNGRSSIVGPLLEDARALLASSATDDFDAFTAIARGVATFIIERAEGSDDQNPESRED